MTPADTFRVERRYSPIRAQVRDNLRQAIVDSSLAPGKRLVERELMVMTGASRTSVREALRELVAEGLVTTAPDKGLMVASVSAEEAGQLCQLRAPIEALAGHLFVKNATAEQRHRLAEAFAPIAVASAAGQSIIDVKDAFFDVLFEGTGNDALTETATALRARVRELPPMSLSMPGRTQQCTAELKAILDAINADDADGAAVAAARHVIAAGEAGVAALRQITASDDGS